ncbi:penicillin-binding transpeptidase domain-containing protein [Streptomyces sp. ISID311]|uniref:penicillin-binding transpeptidase domain-containing protein n=1 Tax=Streptomyces sp. ISID311 TaxID=2601673 RepID=UPI0011BD303C|nr:penicillin-binding transpeptidase domain-containing protein [Streptomyces sp. ISID311]TXC96413.1 penicillin-binding protein 2 [Streptomyces sp. ISID311]
MNRPLRRIAVCFLVLTLALMGRATWIQFFAADTYRSDPHNPRLAIARYSQPLGNILVDGAPVTGSAKTGGTLAYKRTYTDGPLYAPITGFSSQVYGSTQLEGVYRKVLDGSDSRLARPSDTLLRKQPKAGDVSTTVDARVQKAGYAALKGKKGAAVALDPATGKVLSMVSTPSYDPGSFAGSAPADRAAWDKLEKDKNKPHINRAMRQSLAPGSPFKLVVAAAALTEAPGTYPDVDTRTDADSPYPLPGTTISLPNENPAAPCKDATLRVALQYSCNNVFGKVANTVGQDKIQQMAEKFGFNKKRLDIPVRAAQSVYPTGMDRAGEAMSGIGQFNDLATPLQMAMVASAISNDGTLMKPMMVDKLTDGSGTGIQTFRPTRYSKPVTPTAARSLQSAMQSVVTSGTATGAQIPGLTVGAKTGTAQNGVNNSGTPYAWFVSWAKNADGKKVAVASIVQQADAARAEISGSSLAGPVAKAMMKAALPS